MSEHPSSAYPRQIPPTLTIEGDLARADLPYLQMVRRALVTGGRSMLGTVPGRWFSGGSMYLQVKLTPEIEHRIRTSGGTLSEEEIATGMEQLRLSPEDTQARIEVERRDAYEKGSTYAIRQLEIAMQEADERALHRAWETARKVITLRRQITTSPG